MSEKNFIGLIDPKEVTNGLTPVTVANLLNLSGQAVTRESVDEVLSAFDDNQKQEFWDNFKGEIK